MSVIIEYCINCKTHQWNTRHNQARYRDLFTQLKNNFTNLGFKVLTLKYPRLGSFQVSLGEYTLFSKLDSGLFPDVDSVVKFVQEFSKLPDKQSKYKQMKIKREQINSSNTPHKSLSKRPISARSMASFSPLKHRMKLMQYASPSKMSKVLQGTRRQASLTASKTISAWNPYATARSRFSDLKQSDRNPENTERMIRSALRDKFGEGVREQKLMSTVSVMERSPQQETKKKEQNKRQKQIEANI